MEINVRDDKNLVEVWMTSEEKQDQLLQERLKSLYRECRGKKYLVAVFRSGAEELERQTSDLLCYNKKRAAELEVQRERARAMDPAM